jgi:hypothetical protein
MISPFAAITIVCGHGLSLVNSTGWTAETDVVLYSAAHADPAHDHAQRPCLVREIF